MDIISKIKNFIKLFIIEHRYVFSETLKRHKKHLKKLLINNEGKSLSIDNSKKWIAKFNKLTFASPELIDVGIAFATSEITILKNQIIKNDDIIGICIVKNDFIKIKKFVSHHRKLGIDKFVILDNDSNDGSVEWLLEQEDVVLLQTKIPYTTNRREGWINRIIAHYGDNRWYFVADSDELLDYNESEYKNIKDVILYCKQNGISRARAIMIDMYATANYYSHGNKNNFYNECIFFDKDTYHNEKRHHLDLICGGPRERIFKESPWLTKYPLFYFSKNDIECKSHFLFPYRYNVNVKCNLVLKHYKFQPGEIEKIRKIVTDKNYYNGSKQYKKYLEVLEKTKELNFFCDSTIKYENSNSLSMINLYEKIKWK